MRQGQVPSPFQELRKLIGRPGFGHSVRKSCPRPGAVIYAVRKSFPPKQILVMKWSGNGGEIESLLIEKIALIIPPLPCDLVAACQE